MVYAWKSTEYAELKLVYSILKQMDEYETRINIY